ACGHQHDAGVGVAETAEHPAGEIREDRRAVHVLRRPKSAGLQKDVRVTIRSSKGVPRMRVLVRVGTVLVVAGLAPLGLTVMSAAPAVPAEVTFTKHIAPIIQRSCENCHRPDGVAPMSLVTYEDARPWARAMKQRTGIRSQRGAMPPFFVEKSIGIQKFKHDPSLSDEEVATIAAWADAGAPRGNAADMPKALD